MADSSLFFFGSFAKVVKLKLKSLAAKIRHHSEAPSPIDIHPLWALSEDHTERPPRGPRLLTMLGGFNGVVLGSLYCPLAKVRTGKASFSPGLCIDPPQMKVFQRAASPVHPAIYMHFKQSLKDVATVGLLHLRHFFQVAGGYAGKTAPETSNSLRVKAARRNLTRLLFTQPHLLSFSPFDLSAAEVSRG